MLAYTKGPATMSETLAIPGIGLLLPERNPETAGKPQLIRAQMTHDSIIDYVISNPGATHKEIAAAFGYTHSGISIIVNSDAFQMRYHKRKTELIDPLVVANVEARIKGLASQSLEILARKMETSDDAAFALKVLQTTNSAMGLGVAKPQAINTQFVVHLPGPAASTADWQTRFAPADAQVVNAEPSKSPSENG